MSYEYKRVEGTNTLEGLCKAEKLEEQGYKVISTGLTYMLMERVKK
jgi:hypothetical protein